MKRILLITFLSIFIFKVYGQDNIGTPYSVYGIGLQTENVGPYNAMGGVAAAMRDNGNINYLNPASYTAVDSLTFMFDGGISMQNTNFSNGAVKKNAKNSSFDYITMQFRLSKWGAMSIGLLPYSNVGYSMYESGETEDGTPYVNTFSGEGGLHQLYLGAGFKILKNLSIGANISYLWGDMSRSRYQSFSSNSDIMPLTTIYGTEVTSYKLDFGAQYTQQFGKKHSATVGVVFSPGHDLGNDSYVQQQLGNSTTGYSTSQRDTTMTMGIPMTLGAGVTYVYDDRLTVGVDVMFQKWNSVTFMNEPDAFCNRAKIALGAEYIPNLMGRSYLAHIKYRLGAYYSQPYYKIDGVRAANEYGVTAGFGLPLPRSRSVLSISAQYVRTQGKEAQFLNENTLRLCIGVTFNERWFWKRKVE